MKNQPKREKVANEVNRLKTKPKDPTAYAQEIARLIQCGKLPSLEQVQAAILSTREELHSQILAARKEAS